MSSLRLQLIFRICIGLLILNSTAVISINKINLPEIAIFNTFQALYSVVNEWFVPRTATLVISIHVTLPIANISVERLLNRLLPKLSMIKVQLEDIYNYGRNSRNRHYNLIVVDSYEALKDLHPAELTKHYDNPDFYLVYLIQPNSWGVPMDEISKIFKYFWEHYIINVSLLVRSEPTVATLYTYFPFADRQNCKKPVLTEINKFAFSWLKPMQTHVFPEKLIDFQLCPLSAAIWHTPPYLSFYTTQSHELFVHDFEGDLLTELAHKLNFTLDIVVPPNNEERGKKLENGTTTGAIRLLQERRADLSLGSFRYTLERSELLTSALPYYQTWQIYGVLRAAKPYTSLEILTFPFDTITWLLILLSLLVTITIALYLRYQSRVVPDASEIILGQPNPASPVTNICSIFLGIPIVRTPTNNFSRYVIVLLFIYGYLMRTAYQSLLFQLMQTNLYREPPQDIGDLIKDGYTLVMTSSTYDTVNLIPAINQGYINIIFNSNISEISSFVYVENSPDQLLVGVAPRDYLVYYMSTEKKSSLFYILPQKIFAQHITIYFTKHSYLLQRFNYLLMNLRSQGIIDYWARKSFDLHFLCAKTTHATEQVTLKNIKGVFLVYAILNSIAITIFCCEIILNRFFP